MQEVLVPTQKSLLHGTLFEANQSVGGGGLAALLIHGWEKSQSSMYPTAEVLSTEMGITCLTIDLRGHGKTPGDLAMLSRKDCLEDVMAGYDFLSKHDGVSASNIGVVGSSFGAYLAAILSEERKLQWMVLRAPSDYPDNGFDLPKEQMNLVQKTEIRTNPTPWHTTRSLRAVHQFAGNMLLVESGYDDIIPPQSIQNFKDAARPELLEYVFMPHAPHSISQEPEEYAKFNAIVVKWLKRVLPKPVTPEETH